MSDCSSGVSTSDSSGAYSEEARGNGQCIFDSGEEGIYTVKHVSFQKVSVSPVELC